MAQILQRTVDDKVLLLDGSECIFRPIVVPAGAVDIRFMVGLGPLSATSSQTFNPVVSRFETIRQLFVTDNTPTADPTGKFIGLGTGVGGSCRVLSQDISIHSVGSANTNWLTVNGGVSSTAIPASVNITMGNINSTDVSFMMVRLYNDGPNVLFQVRKTQTSRTTATDTWVRDTITNLGATTLQATITATNITIPEIKGVFFSWPFFNNFIRVSYLGYRAIT